MDYITVYYIIPLVWFFFCALFCTNFFSAVAKKSKEAEETLVKFVKNMNEKWIKALMFTTNTYFRIIFTFFWVLYVIAILSVEFL